MEMSFVYYWLLIGCLILSFWKKPLPASETGLEK